MDSEKNLTNEELVELVPRVNTMQVDKRYMNKWFLETLRGLDYLSRGKLLNFMEALRVEQHRTRGSYKESLYRFVSLIDQVEKKIQEDEFAERLVNASVQLPCEKKRALLEFVEQQKRDEN